MAQSSMLFFSFFKSLAEQSQVPARVVLELKNGVKIAGTLEQVDESLNFHLSSIQTLKPYTSLQDCQNAAAAASHELPHFKSCNDMFVRGNVIRYVHLLKSDVDTEPLTEACRKDANKDKNKTH